MSAFRLNGSDFRKVASEILATGNRVRFLAHGGSMHPYIQDGDILVVAPLSEKLIIKCGDVLLVDCECERLLAHRVVKIDHQQGVTRYLIKGDTSFSPDGWFQSENVLGRVEFEERDGLRVLLTLSTQQWKSRLWVMLAPWATRFSWLPRPIRNRLREWLLVS